MASARSKSLLILLLISFSLDEILGELIEEQREFDYFALALQWPGTYCQKTKHCCSSNGCCRSSLSPTEFTIHGLWPDYNDGTWPSCCSGPTFDVTKVSSLMGTLEKYWPSLSCSSSSLCHGGKGLFWAHEWEKHGTCSFPVIQDEYSYFTTVLDLYFKYNISKILNDAGYTPTNGDTYPVVGISFAIENAVGASPKLVCSNGAVEEIYICFYKDFKPRDCIIGSNSQDNMLGSSSCPRYISIPEFTPFAFKDEKAAIPWLPDSEAF